MAPHVHVSCYHRRSSNEIRVLEIGTKTYRALMPLSKLYVYVRVISLCSISSLFGKPVNTDDSLSTFGSAGVGALERIWSISRMPVCEDKSHEEFRWEDYQLGNRGTI